MGILINRLRKLLVAAACAAAAIMMTGPVAWAANNAGLDTIPLVILNKSGSAKKLFVLAYGMANGTNYYMSNAAGDVSTFTNSTERQPIGVALGKGKKYTVHIPKLTAARVYFSFGKKMKLLVTDGNPQTPTGWNKTDPNINTLFDWFEYTWNSNGLPPNTTSQFNGNLTQVDMIGLPMMLRLKGLDAQLKNTFTRAGFLGAKTRSNLMKAMKKAPAPWRKLVVRPGAKIPLRVVSPYNGMLVNGGGLGVFPTNQLQGYINKVFAKYQRAPMYASTNAGGTNATFKAYNTGGSLVFTNETDPQATIKFAKPNSYMAYIAYPGTLPAGSTATGAQAAQIETYVQAGLMRTTMLAIGNISACPGVKKYYKNKPVNFYSKIMHKYGFKHQAYGFGYDDMCEQASDYTVFNPDLVQITINPLLPPKRKR